MLSHTVVYNFIQVWEKSKLHVLVERAGKRIAVEIETEKSDYLYNNRKDLDAEFDEINSVALSNKIKEQIMVQLKESGLY